MEENSISFAHCTVAVPEERIGDDLSREVEGEGEQINLYYAQRRN